MVPKPYEPLPYEEIKKYLIEIDRLIKDGYAFQSIQRMLNRKN